jgi:hypothetical protein
MEEEDTNWSLHNIITTEILADLSLREKSIIANMNETDIENLEATFYRRVKGQGSRIKDGKQVVKRIRAKLYESHRLKVVKK